MDYAQNIEAYTASEIGCFKKLLLDGPFQTKYESGLIDFGGLNRY
jgi:hypothetical protein